MTTDASAVSVAAGYSAAAAGKTADGHAAVVADGYSAADLDSAVSAAGKHVVGGAALMHALDAVLEGLGGEMAARTAPVLGAMAPARTAATPTHEGERRTALELGSGPAPGGSAGGSAGGGVDHSLQSGSLHLP